MRMQGKDGTWYEVPDHIFGDRDGSTFVSGLDKFRLDSEAGLVFIYMTTHGWVTPNEVTVGIGWHPNSSASVTARIRDLRKKKFGGYTVRRRRVAGKNGLHEYRLMDPEGEPWPDSPSSPTSTAPRVLTVVPSPSRPTSTPGWRIAPSSP